MQTQAQNPDNLNTITFYRSSGNTICPVQWAAFSAQRRKRKFELLFFVRGEPMENTTRINAEVSLFVDDFDLETLVGQHYEVPCAYDEKLDDYVAHIYYHDHQDFNNIVLEILARDNNSFNVRWTGTTRDVDCYDGSQPETSVVIEAWFAYEKSRKATYNYPVIKSPDKAKTNEPPPKTTSPTTPFQPTLDLW